MKVRVLTFGVLREMAGIEVAGRPVEIELADDASVGDLISEMSLPADLVFSILIDGSRSEAPARLHDGAEVTLMPAFTGGDR